MNLLGIHDDYPIEVHGSNPGWCVVTIHCRIDPMHHWREATDKLVAAGVQVLARLNWGYGIEGTIPIPARYEEFAALCATWATALPGVHRFIVGNEPNHFQERPAEYSITPGNYAVCFNLCRRAIKRVRPGTEVIVAAPAPYMPEFLLYFVKVLQNVECDGISIHAYTHGSDPSLVMSDAEMETLPGVKYHFRVYQNYMENIPKSMWRLPIYITETNQGDAWDGNTALEWIGNVLTEVNNWNFLRNVRRIHCVCLYRWPNYDRWGIEGNSAVVDAVKLAYTLGYESPQPSPPKPVENMSDDFERAVEFVLRWEGGYANNPADPGGETNWGISKRSYPNLDIKNLTRAAAVEIYRHDYWIGSGAHLLSWPLSLVHFDAAVNHGVGQAAKFFAETQDPVRYVARRLELYVKLATERGMGWALPGWVRRMADLLKTIEE